MSDVIRIQGAREHNLRDIDVEIPRDELVVITGLSGSGKSSLAFDTVYAEGQRRYVESLSSYARQFLGIMEKPDVDQIDGLSPAISIDQKSTSRNPRSTVATVTEVYDYLRLLYARIGVPHCPVCGKKVTKMSAQQIVENILKLPEDTKTMVLAPIINDRKGEFQHVPERFKKAGFMRARVDGVVYDLDEYPELDKQHKHTIEIVVDRLTISDDTRSRLSQSVEQALDLADGTVKIFEADDEREHVYSEHYGCADHPGVSIPELEPRTFSFNSPHGACPVCTGLGHKMTVDPELVIPNKRLTIEEGAIRAWKTKLDSWYMRKLRKVAEEHGFSMSVPVKELSDDALDLVLYGTGEEEYRVELGEKRWYETTFEGVIPNLERRYKETDSSYVQRDIEKYMREKPCPECKGNRLRPEALSVTIHGISIMDIVEVSIKDAIELFDSLELNEREAKIAKQVLKEIKARLRFMNNVGLEYLTLDRSAGTLSGGEAQRIRLATQIGSGLTGVLYVLDEPSIGLHQRDNARLIQTLMELRDLNNTVIVVEHDEETIRSADHVLDIGPAAGARGGEIVAQGTPEDIENNEDSLTGQYLSGTKKIPVPKKRRDGNGKSLTVYGAEAHNLKKIDVEFPLGEFIVVSGVSGSGKSSLLTETVAKQLSHELNNASEIAGKHDKFEGISNIDKTISIDQSPIGRTPRSNPATYTKLFTPIRELFAKTPEARVRGYKKGRFSFNVKGGRCENCSGDGMIQIEMHFLPDVYVQCEVCNGKRYTKEVLEIHYKNKNISDVLEMTVDEAAEFFVNVEKIKRRLNTLQQVGLGYIKLGQPSTTLSGGEAQRIKLATELSKRSTGSTFYILDEPTTGLHFDDVKKLLNVLHNLVEKGNTVVVIEHNLDVIKSADHIIDLGPEGGDKGGEIVAEGTPEQISKVEDSYTGQFLKDIL